MKNKSKIAAVLALGFLLTGCNEIIAKPTQIDDLLVDALSHDINNTFKDIYNDYRDSPNFTQYVLDAVLLAVAESDDVFGKYEDLAAGSDFKIAVDKRTKEMFFNDIRSGSYTYRSKFNEKKFVVDSVYAANSGYIVDALGNALNVNELGALPFYNEGLFLPNIDETNFDDPLNKIVHFNYYTDYIRESYVEDVYREKLVEKYVLDELSATLGRNYARKVTYVAIKNSEQHPTAVSKLFNTFIDENVLGAGNANLEILANAWRGVAADFIGNEADLLDKAGLVTLSLNQTLFGEIETEFNKIKADPDLSSKDSETKFTNNGSYPKEVGLEIEINELRKRSFVTKDWAIKNGGLTALPEVIRNRVFNIGVANGVDFIRDDVGVLEDAGKWIGDDADDRLPNTFVRNIKGSHYLVPKTYEKGNERNFLLFENDTYYIVQIEEAVNTSKLTEGNANYYLNPDKGPIKTEAEVAEITNEIARLISELEATKTNAMNSVMEDLKIVFHDEKIEEFFKTKFPDIFDSKK